MTSPATVSLPAGETGSSLLMGAMAAAHERFPDVFAGLEPPRELSSFKKKLPGYIVPFEAQRAAAAERVDIARFLSDHLRERSHFGEAPLAEGFAEASLGTSTTLEGSAAPGWVPEVTYQGRTWRGAEIGNLGEQMRADHFLTAGAAKALRWVSDELLQSPLVLEGKRFGVLGAGAELAPTPYLLQAGARVLWVDRQAPALDGSTFAGTVVHHDDALDLLAQPHAIGRVVAEEARAGELHLGLFAYAPGRGRELLLTTAMNAITEHAKPASVSMLVSPTTPGEVQPEDRLDRLARRRECPRWQRALAKAKLLPEAAHHAHGDVEIAHSIVPMQGPTYLAAQYLAKMMVAEAWATSGQRVSANVAGITHTKSLEHPLFLAGFRGATSFGMMIFDADQTRVLNTLLMLHDVLNPDAPGADPTGGPAAQAKRLASQAIHGGVRSAPFSFDQLIRVAAVVGLGKQPSLLLKLRKG